MHLFCASKVLLWPVTVNFRFIHWCQNCYLPRFGCYLLQRASSRTPWKIADNSVDLQISILLIFPGITLRVVELRYYSTKICGSLRISTTAFFSYAFSFKAVNLDSCIAMFLPQYKEWWQRSLALGSSDRRVWPCATYQLLT